MIGLKEDIKRRIEEVNESQEMINKAEAGEKLSDSAIGQIAEMKKVHQAKVEKLEKRKQTLAEFERMENNKKKKKK